MEAPNGRRFARMNNFHGPKRQVIGNSAGRPEPAWRTSVASQNSTRSAKQKGNRETGSRIFLSRLPLDVGEKEVEELFRKTVGPVTDSFLIYNSKGFSKGMAVVSFQSPTDALTARAKYDGKIVDGRQPIKIEILVDGVPSSTTRGGASTAPTLLNRLALAPQVKSNPPTDVVSRQSYGQTKKPRTIETLTISPTTHQRVRPKKGPKRLKKKMVTLEDLDKDMDEYRAAAPDSAMVI